MSAGQVWIDNAVVTEGNAGTKIATFTVRRAGGTDAFDMSYATADGIALAADGDYVATSGVLHFGAGVESATISVTVKGDTKFELDEYFFLNLSGATNGAFVWQDQALGAIVTDDKTPAAGNIWINNSSIVEGNSGTRLMTFTVQRSGGSQAFSVNYTTEPSFATEGVDYVKKSGTLTFAAGETSKTITVEVKGDTAFEGNDNFSVVLSGATAGATIGLFGGPGRAVGTILDDDTGGRGVVSIRGPVSVVEGNSGTKVVTFTVTRTGGTGAFSVDYSTGIGDAQAGSDFVQKAGTLQFAAGVDSQTISVTVNGDTSIEADEVFGVFLSNPTNGAIIGQSLGLTAIFNDDGQGPGEVWVDDATVTEGSGGTKVMTFTVSRSSGILPFSVSYQTQDGYGYDPSTGTPFPSATALQDYVARSGVLQFAAGVMSQTVAITINGDTTAETAENFVLILSNATNGAAIRNFVGNGTIVDDDGPIPTTPGRVRIDNVSVVEGNSGTRLATFTVWRSGGSGAFSVDYNTADYGASVVGGDYLAAAGTLQFAAGVASRTFTVAVKGDTTVEELQDFAVVLTNATNGAIIDRSIGYGAILDDDVAGTGTGGDDTLLGTPADDTLDGGGGNDTLDGGTGADTMNGGAGNDTYYVDNAGDKTIEANGAGTDQVFSTVSFSLAGQYVEKLTLTGSSNIDATGNSLANTLTGNAGNNVLNGGTGADTMTGGAGNDTFYVDNASDKTIEANNAGTDQVFSSVSYSLAGQYVETLSLTGSGNTNATGNSLANTLIGNSGNNALNGGTGADTMTGGAGNDTYYVDNAGDNAIEANNAGTDQLFSSVSFSLAGQYVENLTLTGSGNTSATGNSLANSLTGNSGNNALNGSTGNDVLNGGTGTDVLTGGSGLDTFVFDSALAGTIDTVADFSAANDTIQLDRSIFAAITTLGTLSAAAFFNGAAAHDADDRIVYNSATGNLFYDSDGTGANAAVQFARLTGAPAISNADFIVVA